MANNIFRDRFLYQAVMWDAGRSSFKMMRRGYFFVPGFYFILFSQICSFMVVFGLGFSGCGFQLMGLRLVTWGLLVFLGLGLFI